MDADEHKQLAAAHHEAGHAIVGLHFDFSLMWVRLAPQPPVPPDWTGKQGGAFWDPCPSDVDHAVIMIAAGHFAGAIFDPDSDAAKYIGSDVIQIEKMMPRAKQPLDDLKAQAEQLVRENRDLIVRVAYALFKAETRELSGDEVRALKSVFQGAPQ